MYLIFTQICKVSPNILLLVYIVYKKLVPFPPIWLTFYSDETQDSITPKYL